MSQHQIMKKKSFERWSEDAIQRFLTKHPNNRDARAELYRRSPQAREHDRIAKLSDDELWREATSPNATGFHVSVWNSRERNETDRARQQAKKAVAKAKKVADQHRQHQIDAARQQFRAMSIDELMAWQPPQHATGFEFESRCCGTAQPCQ